MKIKKYTGASFQEAFEQMKAELGGDAIILNSRKLKNGGALDFLARREVYEITASAETQRLTGDTGPVTTASTTPAEKARRIHVSREFSPTETALPAESRGRAVISEAHFVQQVNQMNQLRQEISDMKKVVEQVADFVKYSRMPALPQVFKNILKKLVQNEVHEELAKAVVQTTFVRTRPEHYNQTPIVEKNLFSLLKQIIRIAPPINQVRRKPYVVVLVGPTGVGKTTTIAKIASGLKLFEKRQVALISADTYRIAAIEQLQTFANIASIPMRVVYSPDEMLTALQTFSEKDVIFVDTVGRSPRNSQQLGDLQKFVDAADPQEVHLVLSLASSSRGIMDTVKRFAGMRPNRLLFTKVDESSGPGMILNVLYKHRLPVSYLTTGQTVPNDIVAPTPDVLARLVYQGVLP